MYFFCQNMSKRQFFGTLNNQVHIAYQAVIPTKSDLFGKNSLSYTTPLGVNLKGLAGSQIRAIDDNQLYVSN